MVIARPFPGVVSHRLGEDIEGDAVLAEGVIVLIGTELALVDNVVVELLDVVAAGRSRHFDAVEPGRIHLGLTRFDLSLELTQARGIEVLDLDAGFGREFVEAEFVHLFLHGSAPATEYHHRLLAGVRQVGGLHERRRRQDGDSCDRGRMETRIHHYFSL